MIVTVDTTEIIAVVQREDSIIVGLDLFPHRAAALLHIINALHKRHPTNRSDGLLFAAKQALDRGLLEDCDNFLSDYQSSHSHRLDTWSIKYNA